jgi:hypothetical protein
MAEKEYTERDCSKCFHYPVCDSGGVCACYIPAADVVEVDKVAEMLRLSFGDDCACNFNGNDEWMWEKCKYAETDCPYPKEDNGCWKEFVKHFIAKMDGKGEGE